MLQWKAWRWKEKSRENLSINLFLVRIFKKYSMIASIPLYLLLARAWKQQTAHRLHQMLQQSRLMLSVIVLFVMSYWVFFTWFFHYGIHYVQFNIPALGDLLLSRMFYLLFALVFSMLTISSVIIGYGVFFRNQETAWLQTLPVSHEQLFRWKFVEMSFLASWAFVFLSGPLLLAYAIALKLSLLFLVGVFILYIPFSLLANTLGTILVLAFVCIWHHRWGRRVIILSACTALGFGYGLFKPVDVPSLLETETVPLLNLLFKNTQLVMAPLLPSYWLASAVIGLGEKLWMKPLFFLAVTTSYTLLAGWFVLRYSGQLFYNNTSRVQDRRLHGKAYATRTFMSPLFWSGKLLVGWAQWLKRPVRSILWKDWITFWRDTTQWSQFAIFFGLLGFYFFNIRNFHYQLDDRFWVSIVSFLNLMSLGLTLATLTTRFVFPQFSLEGRRLWLIGLAPITLHEIVWGKFWASVMMSGSITIMLMLFSFSSLQLETSFRWIISFTVVMMSLGLSGIAVGMGVLFPNMKQSNAAQIVSGFGGTCCLILSLVYVALIVVVVALPTHLRYMAKQSLEFQFTSSVGVVYMVVFAISLTAMLLPMHLAEKKFNRLEI